MTSPAFNLSDATGLEIEFYFKAVGVEAGEDFWVQYKNPAGVWVTIGQLIQGVHFNNNTFYLATVSVPGFTPNPSAKLRIQCDASDDTDQVYIDQVTITKFTGTQLIKDFVVVKPVLEIAQSPVVNNKLVAADDLMVYPNPVTDVLNISFHAEIRAVRLMSLDGREIAVSKEEVTDRQLNLRHLSPGMYFLWVQSGDEWYPVKFSKM
jgi:hypothetical protein